MDRDIEVYECLSGEDRERFWLKLREYFRRDIFPGEESCYHCSDVDLELYRALGFTTRLGTNLTMPLPYES